MAEISPEMNTIISPIDEIKRNNRKSRIKPLTREDVLKALTRIINEQRDRATNGRIRDPDVEKARRESARIVIYACSVYINGLRDQELEKIEERLSQLEGGLIP